MSKPVKAHNFRGRKYNVKKISPSKIKRMCPSPKGMETLGYCEPPEAKRKSVMFDSTLEGLEELDVHIHEAIHACYWDLSEAAVDMGSTDIAKFLWRLGYRKVE